MLGTNQRGFLLLLMLREGGEVGEEGVETEHGGVVDEFGGIGQCQLLHELVLEGCVGYPIPFNSRRTPTSYSFTRMFSRCSYSNSPAMLLRFII